MQTLYLDGSLYQTAQQLHTALRDMLCLPSWYGGNADALNDCLSERTEPVSLWIASYGNPDTERALRLVCRVVADNGGSIREL